MPSSDITRASVLLRLDPALLERIDLARGDEARNVFLCRLLGGALDSPGSSSGRTLGSGPRGGGSIPSPGSRPPNVQDLLAKRMAALNKAKGL